MTRRQLLKNAAAALVPASSQADAPAKPVEIRIDPASVLGKTPDDFLGFGYEISSVAVPRLFSAKNKTLLQYYRNLGNKGVVRIGGNTADFSKWEPYGQAVSAPKATVTNKQVIDDLGAFLHATGWQLIWNLNLGSSSVESAVNQAMAVAAAAKDRLLCFQIGNEPDLFSRSEHRPASYGYAEYYREFSRFAAALRNRLPGAPLAGPDVAGAMNWVVPFAEAEGKKLNLLTAHYYRAGQKQPAATFQNLLNTDPRFLKLTSELKEDSHRFGIPYRLCELNSFSGGGKPGVSDTFTSALWALDLLFTLAFQEGAGINLETGVNQLGFVSSYSPIFEDEQGQLSARPCYYAMLAFALAGRGKRIKTTLAANGLNLTAFSTMNEAGNIWLTVINKDLASRATVKVAGLEQFAAGHVLRLTAPRFDSKTNVKLGGAEVSNEGHWNVKNYEHFRTSGGNVQVPLEPASAALIHLS